MENNIKIPLIERIVVCGISKEKIDDFCVGYSKEEIWIIVLMCVIISLVIMCIALILFFCRYNKKYEFVEVVDANDNIQEKV